MRTTQEFSEWSYSSLLSKIKRFVLDLSSTKEIEALSTIYEQDSNSSSKFKAIIIIKDKEV